MTLHITSLNSGSNGNCYYIGNEREAVLIDAGISCRETEKRMKALGLCMSKVRAVFISHEHSDHIQGLPVLAKKWSLPVYATPGTLRYSRLEEGHIEKPIRAYDPIQVGDLKVTAFPKLHDAEDPHSFVVRYQDTKVGVFTDIGAPCEHLAYHFQQCQVAILEANYDEELLSKGHYPHYLKQRIRGGKGHLSNAQALQFFLQHRSPHLQHLVLAHLSRDNNRPELVTSLFAPHAGTTTITVASRYAAHPLITLGEQHQVVRPATQASLFD